MTNAKYEIFTRLRGSHDSNLDGDAPPIIGKHNNFQEKQSFRKCYNEVITFPNTRRLLHWFMLIYRD